MSFIFAPVPISRLLLARQLRGIEPLEELEHWKEFIVERKAPIGKPMRSLFEEERTVPDLILLGARQEVKNGTRYDASYEVISYPGGDVPSDRGACTDVVIRAFRNAGIDLQQLIHEDMKKNFHLYPQKWGLECPDANIDHRRVPNQVCFLSA